MADIHVSKFNEVYVKITCDLSTAEDIHSYFTFFAPGYEFNPLFLKRKWDGKIRLYNKKTRNLYSGLVRYLIKFAEERSLTIEVDESVNMLNNFSIREGEEYIKSLNIHSRGEPLPARDYQVMGFTKAIRYKRMLLVSPTASGKSFMMYSIMRYLLDNGCKRGLIIVPFVSLVEQLYKDFEDYSNGQWSVDDHCQKIYQGQSQIVTKNVTISTWQSIYDISQARFFEQFDFVIGDEAHTFKAKSLAGIMTNLTNAEYRIGTTGTLDDIQVHKLTLEGYFGPASKIVTTKQLMDDGHISTLQIKALILKYDPATCKALERDYQAEIDFIVSCDKRNKFLRNLTLSIKGNTLLLFQYVERHGKILFDLISKQAAEGRKVFFVYGGTEIEDRENIRKIVENEKDAIIIASYGVYSTGVNIRNLHNIIFASPSKSKIRNLQSIGRGLRKGDDKDTATLYDIVDDLRNEKYINYALKHYGERFKIYQEEKFNLQSYKIGITL